MKENNLSRNPHQTLWLGLLVLIIFAWIIPCKGIDIQMHDTYLSMSTVQFAMGISLFLGFLGLSYWALIRIGKQPIKALVMGHIALSLFTVMSFIFLICEYGTYQMMRFGKASYEVIDYAVLLFWIGQVLFFVDMVLSFFRKQS